MLDQSAIFEEGQSSQIDAVALLGYENEYHADVVSLQDPNDENGAQPKLLRQWVKNVPSASSQFGQVYYTKERLIGRPSYFPNYSSNPTVWSPAQMATSNEFVEVEYETAVYVAAVEVFETTNPGGIRRISARDDKGAWHAIYETDRLQKIEGSRRFTPKVKRTNFKSNALRLDIDQTAAKWYVCIDTVWLYGYEHEHEHKVGNDEESNEPEELIKRWYPRMYDDELDRDEPLRTELQQSEALLYTLAEDFLKWLGAAVKLAWFLIDIGQYEITEAYLDSIVLLVERKNEAEPPPVETSKKLAEAYYAFIVLFTRWRSKYSSAANPVVRHCMEKGRKYVGNCYQMYKSFWNEDDIQFGVVLSACAYFDDSLNSKALQLFERKAYKRGLVDLYIRKGGEETNNGDISVPCSYYDKAKEFAYSEFGKYHEQTASVHQDYAAAFWNRWMDVSGQKDSGLLEECLKHSDIELEIREVMLGFNHPSTLRARGMSAMVLERLGRQEEAQKLRQSQPKGLRVEPNWV